ncbi:MAG: AzlD domain-containing protein [Clostridiales bacterium]|nr:AzlD domain-containing protein [Clostridiales bacterium]
MRSIYLYLAAMAGVTCAVHVLPLTLIRRPLRSRFLRSFLYYTPYVTLAVMTFPAVPDATRAPLAGALALAWAGQGLLQVSAACCAVVFIAELLLCR